MVISGDVNPVNLYGVSCFAIDFPNEEFVQKTRHFYKIPSSKSCDPDDTSQLFHIEFVKFLYYRPDFPFSVLYFRSETVRARLSQKQEFYFYKYCFIAWRLKFEWIKSVSCSFGFPNCDVQFYIYIAVPIIAQTTYARP